MAQRRSLMRMVSRLVVPLALMLALVLGAPLGLVLAQIDPQVRDRVVPAMIQVAILVDVTDVKPRQGRKGGDGCHRVSAPLESTFRWQGTFYSQTAQSFFFSDTGMTEPAEVDPASVPALPIDEVNFREVHLALARAGYDEDAELNPATGASVRLNAPTDPFGPPGTPQGLVYYVAITGQGTVQDLFVSSPGWTMHHY